MQTKKISYYILYLSRAVAGFVFIYSGFVKGIDPLGSAYKFTDYFVAFNLEFLESLSLPLSVILATAEMLIGIAIIAGLQMVIASWAILLFMIFFTILTFIIALTDPVADCGCFGDAIILTNWQTFWKNIVLMLFVLHIFIRRKKFNSFFRKPFMEWITLVFFTIIITGIYAYSYWNLPVIDFRPYSIGSNIEEKMNIPPDAPADEYEITLYYENNGEIQPFSVDELPGSEWEWVRTESTLISRGYEPEISGFFIESVEDEIDYTDEILGDPGYTFMLVAYNLAKSSEKSIPRLNRLAEWSAGQDVKLICLTASSKAQIDDFSDRTGALYDFYHSDEIILKTIIRSNPGLLLLKEGTIIGKWHHRNIPHADELKENLLSYSLEMQQVTRNSIITCVYLLALILLLALLRIIRPVVNKRF